MKKRETNGKQEKSLRFESTTRSQTLVLVFRPRH